MSMFEDDDWLTQREPAFNNEEYYPKCEPPVDVAIERWGQALRLLDGMSEHERKAHFDMSSWGFQNACGTIACLAGHCSLDPWFRERGFTSEWYVYETKEDHRERGRGSRFQSIAELQFGEMLPGEFFGRIGKNNIFLMIGDYAEVHARVTDYLMWLNTNKAVLQELRTKDGEAP